MKDIYIDATEAPDKIVEDLLLLDEEQFERFGRDLERLNDAYLEAAKYERFDTDITH